jgi:hypothetical protein
MPVSVAAARSKYGARPVTIDGIRFASGREARRYAELKILERVGQIWDLTLQAEFVLHVRADVAQQRIGVYRADFVYRTAEGTVVEDAKGVRTALYKWKKKHTELEYGVRIVEV